MLEKLKTQINEILEELEETKKMSPDRVKELILKTQEIAKSLDNEKDLDGVFEGRIASIYKKGETKHPKKRLNVVVGLLMEKAGLMKRVK